MTPEKFKEFHKQLTLAEIRIFTCKGEEYSGNNDRFKNFKELGEELNLPPEKVLLVFLHKHMSSIRSYVKFGHELSSESIYGRINDARNYLALLAGMISEKEDKEKDALS